MAAINSSGQTQVDCQTQEVVGEFEPKILDKIKVRLDGYLKAYLSEDIDAISNAINLQEIDNVRRYLEKRYRDEDYRRLRSGIKQICVEKMTSTTCGYLTQVNAQLEYKDEGRKPEPVFFYIMYRNDVLIFTELMFANYETYHINWPPSLSSGSKCTSS
ncbi:MAG TPA: hypothetical protein PKD24_16810 [Pyrinomonadaceae bacterium]|nr:hypothetical protein [Pyrinomonadaceae bacterium]HMP66682.1 hypothetical protein [Pyrinomonadaceae bacterium]